MSSIPEHHHKHKCHFCGLVWFHHDINDVAHGSSGAHECPGCHRCNWSLGIYTGTQDPVCQNGVEPPENAKAGAIHPDQNHTFS